MTWATHVYTCLHIITFFNVLFDTLSSAVYWEKAMWFLLLITLKKGETSEEVNGLNIKMTVGGKKQNRTMLL